MTEQDSATDSERPDAALHAALHAEVPPLPPLPPEHRARLLIDGQLMAAGWAVQDRRVMNLFAPEQGIAMREFVMAPGHGRVDYLLYVDRKVVGVIEARAADASLPTVDWQAALYAAGLPEEHRRRAVERNGRLPFVLEASGLETHFTNGFDPEPRPRRIFAPPRPETLSAIIRAAETDAGTGTWRGGVQHLPPLDGGTLRPGQITAIHSLEGALAAQHAYRSLIQMATGAGKSFTAIAAAHRLLKYGGMKRILVLVDRNNLADQAVENFRNYRAAGEGVPFGEQYSVEKLTGPSTPGRGTVVISTIQRLHRALQGRDVPDMDDPGFDAYVPDAPVTVGYSPDLPPETFDVVILDDAHPSAYGVWSAVLEYFDAHIVGLTATPDGQAFAFFGQNPLSEYSYPRAVADGVNVDFDVYRIRTALTETGSLIDAGPVVPRGERRPGAQRYRQLEEDLGSLAPHPEPAVTAPAQLRTVLETFRDRLFTDIFPGRSIVPKTLIFCRDEAHADQVLAAVREVFGDGVGDGDAYGNDFAAKITYHADDHERQLQTFRDSPRLRVAVTVTMIATGTDVAPLECLLFLRDVRSAAYFEQLKGRGARTMDSRHFTSVTPDATEKTRFVIVDAVGVTEHDFVEPPLNRCRTLSLEQLLGKAAAHSLSEDEVATLAGRLSALSLRLGPKQRAELDTAAGGSLRDLVRPLVHAVDRGTQAAAIAAAPEQAEDTTLRGLLEQAVQPLAANPGLRSRILQLHRVVEGPASARPADQATADADMDPGRARSIVDAWQHYLTEHGEEVPALRPLGETPGHRIPFLAIQELAERIARPPYSWTPELIWSAYETVVASRVRHSDRRTLTDLVSLLRFALGEDDELVAYADRVRERYAAWLVQQAEVDVQFTDDQRWWLDRIVEVIAVSAGIGVDDLNTAPFTERGGASGVVRDLGIDAARIIESLNVELTVEGLLRPPT